MLKSVLALSAGCLQYAVWYVATGNGIDTKGCPLYRWGAFRTLKEIWFVL